MKKNHRRPFIVEKSANDHLTVTERQKPSNRPMTNKGRCVIIKNSIKIPKKGERYGKGCILR